MISIIIPFYNVENYIEATLNSVKNQTFSDFEVVMINDGSTDSSAEICKKFSDEDPRFKLFNIEHAGVSVGRNTGLKKASGDYFYFLDGDDIIIPNALQLLYTALIENNADMAQGNFKYVYEDMSDYPISRESPIKDRVVDKLEYLGFLKDVDGFYYIMNCNKLCRRCVFDGVVYPEGKIHEDHFAIHHIVYNCEKIVCIETRTYLYIKRKNSITMKTFSLSNLTREEAIYCRTRFYEEKGLTELAADCAVWGLKTLPRVTQYCYTRGLYTPEVKAEIDKFFKYEYELCQASTLKQQRLILRILFKFMYKHPDAYISYLKLKYKLMKAPE